jgi:phosphopantetheine adenylyltransferase
MTTNKHSTDRNDFEEFWSRFKALMDQATDRGLRVAVTGLTGDEFAGSSLSVTDLNHRGVPAPEVLATQAEAVAAIAKGKDKAAAIFAKKGLL